MKKDKKNLRSAAVEAQREMERCLGDSEKFGEAERKYKVAQAAYRSALDEEEEERLEEEKKEGEVSDEKRNSILRDLTNAVMRGTGESKFELKRTITSAVIDNGTANMASAGLPLTIQDIIDPLEMELIYDKLDIKVSTGVKGDLIWPCLDTTAEVKVADETVQVTETNLDFSKIDASPQRLAIKVKVSNESVNDASFDLAGYVVTQMQKSLGRGLNKAVIGKTGLGKLHGPFYGEENKRGAVTFAGAMPTYKELLSMKGIVAGKGCVMIGFCYIMNATTYAELEATPITPGDSRMIIEGGKIAGYPVHQTDSDKLGDGDVNAGCFGYVALNQHGEATFTIDPYTMADSNITVYVLNARWSVTTLKHEGFVVGTATAEDAGAEEQQEQQEQQEQ